MSEDTGAVEAAVETPVAEAPVESAPEAPVERSKGTGEAIDRALAKMGERQKAETKPEAKPEGEQPRGPDGKFAPKEAQPETAAQPVPQVQTPTPPEVPDAPPPWLAETAKADWSKAPPSVRAEFGRRIGELEKGLNEYRGKWEPLREFEQLAQQTGTTIPDALRNYVGIEQTLRADPIKGLGIICRNLGIDPRQMAQHVLSMPELTPEQKAAQQQLEAVEAQQAQLQRQNQQMAQQMVGAFFASNPRAEELGEIMGYLISTGKASSLPDAYEKAQQLIPAAAPAPQTGTPPAAQTRDPAPQKSTPDLSLDGAPASNAASRVRSKDTSEALRRAAAQVGLSL